MDELTFHLLKIVISVCSALIAFYLVPILKNKLKDDKYAKLLEMIDIAVRAAEQTTKGIKMGPVKKDNVIIFMTEWANNAGIEITQDQLSQLIEAAVYEMNMGV